MKSLFVLFFVAFLLFMGCKEGEVDTINYYNYYGVDVDVTAVQDVSIDQLIPEVTETEGGAKVEAETIEIEEVVCVPNCKNKECGGDGCGGNCGTCVENEKCENGKCVCVPNCKNLECGSDGCGGSCGGCEENEKCENGKCVLEIYCGNGKCDLGETNCNCFFDNCPAKCGDGCCEPWAGEIFSNCPNDCPTGCENQFELCFYYESISKLVVVNDVISQKALFYTCKVNAPYENIPTTGIADYQNFMTYYLVPGNLVYKFFTLFDENTWLFIDGKGNPLIGKGLEYDYSSCQGGCTILISERKDF